MAMRIPDTMRALLLERHHDDITQAIRSLQVVHRPVPKPGRGQVLVRIAAAPCNPSDLMFLRGHYGAFKTLPSVPGWEGAGTVVASGGGALAAWLRGKRVACGLQGNRDGTWAEYFVADATSCIPLQRSMTLEQGATLIVNPLSAAGLLDTARRGGHRAAIHTAGASQLGRMLVTMAAEWGYPLISVVRRQAQVDLLGAVGATDVLNSSDPDFLVQLRNACSRLPATAAFDAVGGEFTGTLLGVMPPGSVIYVYGALAGSPCANLDPVDLIFHGKMVTGFYLGRWVQQRGALRTLRWANRVQRMILDGRIRTTVQRRAGFDDLPEALQEYVDHMTDGKVLLLPGEVYKCS